MSNSEKDPLTSNEKLQEAIDLLYECRDMLALYDGRHAELYERVWKWCQENRNAAHVNETGEAPTPHHVQYDTVGWLCSVCGGWNREAFTSCSHPHPQNDGSAHG